jgi:hypothetical protein
MTNYQVVSPKYTGSLSKVGRPLFPFSDRKSIIINSSLTIGLSLGPINVDGVIVVFRGSHPVSKPVKPHKCIWRSYANKRDDLPVQFRW